MEFTFDAAAAKYKAKDEQECKANDPDTKHYTGVALSDQNAHILPTLEIHPHARRAPS